MTELEIMQRAKMYIDKLANGIDPLSDQPVPDLDCINQVRISKCLCYVSDVLQQVIENGGTVKKKRKNEKTNVIKKDPFSITQEELDRFVFSNDPLTISEITNQINTLIDTNAKEMLAKKDITMYLLQGGYLEQKIGSKKKSWVPTMCGKENGFLEVKREGINGIYSTITCDINAQMIILDEIDAIVEINHQKINESNSLENQGKPWTSEQEEQLIEWFKTGVPFSTIAKRLKRSRGGITARLEKLGYLE